MSLDWWFISSTGWFHFSGSYGIYFCCDLLLMIDELLFPLLTKWNSRFPFGLLKMTSLAFIDSKLIYLFFWWTWKFFLLLQVAFFVSHIIHWFDSFVFHIQAMCYSPLSCTLYWIWRCRRDCKNIQMKVIKYYRKPLGSCH